MLALALQGGLQLTPSDAAATASFVSLSSQGGANDATMTPAMASLLALSAAAAGNTAANGGQGVNGGNGGRYGGSGSGHQFGSSLQQLIVAAAAAQSLSPGLRLPPNNNGSTVLVISYLNEEVSTELLCV